MSQPEFVFRGALARTPFFCSMGTRATTRLRLSQFLALNKKTTSNQRGTPVAHHVESRCCCRRISSPSAGADPQVKVFGRLDTNPPLSTSCGPLLSLPLVEAQDLTPYLASPVSTPGRPLRSVQQ